MVVLALLTLPVAALAGTTTTFSGTIPTGTTVSVVPSTISLGTIQPPVTYDPLQVYVNVTTYESVNWVLKAQDTTPGSTSKGFLYSTIPVRNLTTPFRLWDFTLPAPAYQPLGSGIYTWYSGVGTGSTNVSAKFQQEVTRNDLAGSYNMVVTFTWVAA
jgi:hypothetical protein